MKFKDYYNTLGIERGASPEEVKRAYRRLARKYHPDVSKEPDAETRFKEVGEAYEVLKDPEKRAAYDQLGANYRAGQDFRPPPGWDAEFRSEGFGEPHFDFSDFFESLFGGRARTGGFRAGGFQARGGDEHARVAVTLEEAYRGTERTFQLSAPQVDPQGRVSQQSRTLRVRIPAGVTEGQQIRLAGQGGGGMGGAPAGDLYLQVSLEPHPVYRVEGRDIYLNLPIAPWEAALGATVQVPTLGGRVDLKIPAGSQSGRKLRLKGRGLGGARKGDQYVVLQIVTPAADTPAARALYERMAAELGFDPRAHLEA